LFEIRLTEEMDDGVEMRYFETEGGKGVPSTPIPRVKGTRFNEHFACVIVLIQFLENETIKIQFKWIDALFCVHPFQFLFQWLKFVIFNRCLTFFF